MYSIVLYYGSPKIILGIFKNLPYYTMNILNPEVVWIEGRCYRVNDPITGSTSLHEYDMYGTEEIFNEENDEGDDDFEIVTIDSSRFSTSIHVSKHYVGHIIGKKGITKSRIERDTKTEIKIPRQGQMGDIVIFGSSISNLKAARRRINMIVMSSRMKQKYTHFISIPMNSTEIVSNFQTFKDNVLCECPEKNIEESLFIKPTKLHLTIGMMCLMDNEERLHVSKLLTEAKDSIIMPLIQKYQPLKIRLKGLSYMNDDPTQIDVLYGLVQEEGSPEGLVQTIADNLVELFYKAGFMDKEYDRDSVKLHVTLMNSRYRGEAQPAGSRGREPFDGSGMLKKFADYDFGTAELTEIHLSQRSSMGADGYYQPTCIISCNS